MVAIAKEYALTVDFTCPKIMIFTKYVVLTSRCNEN